ncbi:hypothetical protein B0H13DRAFT_2058643 [Mycena leptocephala]|nr:hypothetical protein B0H13DRAFT_2058643 [Mycena leptocephala]
MPSVTFAYYCSGHGYGHATRVSALAGHLLRLPEPDRPTVHIVSSAPKHVFADSIVLGAVYRNANIDPVIVQPLAYRVDRQRSVAVLKSFLEKKDVAWLREIHADCVLSDAAFVGCLAATAVGIPSILITNFTFDSVYSYLSTTLVDAPASPTDGSHSHFNALVPDIPVSRTELEPLVEHIHAGYRCADLLLRLPGYIPIPSFAINPALPSSEWVDPLTNRFHNDVFASLDGSPSTSTLHPPVEYRGVSRRKPTPRQVVPVPLLVRSPSQSVYSPTGRSRFLHSVGIPSRFHDPNSTKILVVSFGGQAFRRPSRSGSATSSRRVSRELSPVPGAFRYGSPPKFTGLGIKDSRLPTPSSSFGNGSPPTEHEHSFVITSPRLATASHLWIPGAPPASKPLTTPLSPRATDGPLFQTIPPTPDQTDSTYDQAYFDFDESPEVEELPRLLPDGSWIAIVCGFFVAPRDVYMPDLTAVGDVLLGKLGSGYGTVSECVDSCTPFVYVSRPLFIEEHGLRRLLDHDGVGVELSRESYEAGDWAGAIETAWQNGKAGKSSKRKSGEAGLSLKTREEEGRKLAMMVVIGPRNGTLLDVGELYDFGHFFPALRMLRLQYGKRLVAGTKP